MDEKEKKSILMIANNAFGKDAKIHTPRPNLISNG